MRGQFYVLAAVIILSTIYLTARYLNEGLVLQPAAPADELLFSEDLQSSFQQLASEPERDFGRNYDLLRDYIDERSAGSFSVAFNCSGPCPSDTMYIKTTGRSGEIDFKFNFSAYRPPKVWWDNNITDSETYDYRAKIILSENSGFDHKNWPVVITGYDLNYSGIDLSSIEINSMRLVDPNLSSDEADETDGNDIPFQFDEKNGGLDYTSSNSIFDINDEVVFVTNLTAYQTKDMYLYYSKTGSWSKKDYSTDLNFGNYYINNSIYHANYSSDWSFINALKVDFDGGGPYNDTNLISTIALDAEGTVNTVAGKGPIVNGPIRVIIDSAIYNVTSSDFSGNITRRVIHWAYSPSFELLHFVSNSNNLQSYKISPERISFSAPTWYRAFYSHEAIGPASGWENITVSEQVIPGYIYAVSSSGGSLGFIFTDSPANYQASQIIQWSFESFPNSLSRKAWLRDEYSSSSRWQSWLYLSNSNTTEEPISIWRGIGNPLFERVWFEESS